MEARGEEMSEPKPFCVLIQWGPSKARSVMDRPVCPSCGGEAEEIVALHGGPGYAHKVKSPKRRAARPSEPGKGEAHQFKECDHEVGLCTRYKQRDACHQMIPPKYDYCTLPRTEHVPLAGSDPIEEATRDWETRYSSANPGKPCPHGSCSPCNLREILQRLYDAGKKAELEDVDTKVAKAVRDERARLVRIAETHGPLLAMQALGFRERTRGYNHEAGSEERLQAVESVLGEAEWIIRFDDVSVEDEVFSGAGAMAACRAAYEKHLENWNCTVFVRFDVDDYKRLAQQEAAPLLARTAELEKEVLELRKASKERL